MQRPKRRPSQCSICQLTPHAQTCGKLCPHRAEDAKGTQKPSTPKATWTGNLLSSSRKVPAGTHFRDFASALIVRAFERTLGTSMGGLWASNRPPRNLQEAGYRERGVCLPGAPGSRDPGYRVYIYIYHMCMQECCDCLNL